MMCESKILHPQFVMNYFADFYEYVEQNFKDIKK